MPRIVIALAVLLALTGRSAADPRPAPAPPPPRGYVGVAVGVFPIVGEATLEGGFAPIRQVGFVWLHAKVLTGDDDTGDQSEYKYRAALAGLELRTPGRRVRGVVGFDVGAARVRYYNEGTHEDTTTQLARTWHVSGEVVLREAVLHLGLTGSAREPKIPLLTLGLAVQF